MDFISDGDVWTEITVNVNDQKNTFNEVPGAMSLKLFGNKRNTNAKIIYGDALTVLRRVIMRLLIMMNGRKIRIIKQP